MNKKVFLLDACVMYDVFKKDNLNILMKVLKSSNVKFILGGKKLKEEYFRDAALSEFLQNLTLDMIEHGWKISTEKEDISFEKKLQEFLNSKWKTNAINKEKNDPHIVFLCEFFNVDVLVTKDCRLLKEIVWKYKEYFDRRPPMILTNKEFALKFNCYEQIYRKGKNQDSFLLLKIIYNEKMKKKKS